MFLGYTLKYLGESGDYKDPNLFRKLYIYSIIYYIVCISVSTVIQKIVHLQAILSNTIYQLYGLPW